MGEAEQILVIFLASFLALFLLLGIIALVKLIQVLNHLKRISETAEKLATKAENLSELFTYTAAPAAIGRLVASIGDVVFRHKKKNRKNRDD